MHQQSIDTPSGPVEFVVAGDGPSVLYFHGTLSGNELVIAMERSLIDAGFRLVVPHRPGYYGTPLKGRTAVADCADLAAIVLNHLQIDRAAVMGTSAGGPPALAFAIRHPNRTAALLLQCAQTHRWDDARWAPSNQRWQYDLFRRPWGRWLFANFLPLLYRVRYPFTRHNLRAMTGPRYAEVKDDTDALDLAKLLHRTMRRIGVHRAGFHNDLCCWLRENVLDHGTVHTPTMILYDPLDPLAPECHAEFAAAAIAQARLVKLAAGGHLLGFGRDGQRMHATRVEFLREHLHGGNSSATHDNTHAA